MITKMKAAVMQHAKTGEKHKTKQVICECKSGTFEVFAIDGYVHLICEECNGGHCFCPGRKHKDV